MIRNGFVTVNDVKYYVAYNGKITAAGLVEVDGEYYYARTNGVVATGKYYVTRWSSTELKAQFGESYYYFDETGKMIRNGFLTVNNVKYYVGTNGKIAAAGLVEVDGEYYYARTSGAVATGKYYVNKWSTDTLRYRFPANNYQFDAEGKMIR
jgi:glucan-binding YG repeat protein